MKTHSKTLLVTLIFLLMFSFNGYGAITYSDDFEDGNANGWTSSGGVWSVSDSEESSFYYLQTEMASDYYSYVDQVIWKDYTFEAKVKRVEVNGWGSCDIIVRRDGDNFYLLQLGNNAASLWRVMNGWEKVKQVQTANALGTWYTYKIQVVGDVITIYKDGNEILSFTDPTPLLEGQVGFRSYKATCRFDDIFIVNLNIPFALEPSPADGAIHENTWVKLSWKPGNSAVSHDVYLGDDFDVVDEATRDSDVFRGNQALTFYIAGLPGYAYPEGLESGRTYYWRVDEVNEADPNSPWKGQVWSFSTPPKTAYDPVPADGGAVAGTTATLNWSGGLGAMVHTVYFGEDYDQVNLAIDGGILCETPEYSPSQLESEMVYYWRVDEGDGFNTYKGDVWTFTTPGAVGNLQPANGATDVAMTTSLRWTAADNAASHQLYFGVDKDAVRNADTGAPEYKGAMTLDTESYDPGLLELGVTYYWRLDAVYDGIPVKGPVWSFTVGNYLVIDDFESYTDDDAANQAIWQHWVDGFGVDDNGAQVGYLLPPYAEKSIVHSGSQSMPILYLNEDGVKNSEVMLTLTSLRDWTLGSVEEMSLWFRGDLANAAEPLYVALANTVGAPAVITHSDPIAANKSLWTEWAIPLQAIADQGINLTNMDTIAIGLGNKAGIGASGGSGRMYIDDIRLSR